MFMSFKEIHAAQKKPLEFKIQTAVEAIASGFDVCFSRPALAFSGGKDSTVLWHIIREHFPLEAESMAVIFGNTGVEYPESLSFARTIGKVWGGNNFHEAELDRTDRDGLKYEAQKRLLEWLIKNGEVKHILKKDGKLKSMTALEKACPPKMWAQFEKEGLIWKKGTPKSFNWCIDQYGYPILGKRASKLQARRINIDCFLKFGETSSDDEDLKRYYAVLKTAKISQGCCDVIKKNPSKRVQRELKVDVLFLGMMASESFDRKRGFAKKGHLFEVVTESRQLGMPVRHCHPLGLWTDDDIWEYTHRFSVPYSPLYDITYKCEITGAERKISRNGCMGCYTGYGRKNGQMYVMRQTHPDHWKRIMKNGMAEEIKKLRSTEKYRPTKKDYHRLAILDVVEGNEHLQWAIENRPCAFD